MAVVRGTTLEDVINGFAPTVLPEGQDYLRAAEILRERGWAKLIGENAVGEVCAGGAILLAVNERLGEGRHRIMGDEVAHQMNLPWRTVQDWNDEPERTEEEILKALEDTGHRLLDEQDR